MGLGGQPQRQRARARLRLGGLHRDQPQHAVTIEASLDWHRGINCGVGADKIYGDGPSWWLTALEDQYRRQSLAWTVWSAFMEQ